MESDVSEDCSADSRRREFSLSDMTARKKKKATQSMELMNERKSLKEKEETAGKGGSADRSKVRSIS